MCPETTKPGMKTELEIKRDFVLITELEDQYESLKSLFGIKKNEGLKCATMRRTLSEGDKKRTFWVRVGDSINLLGTK